MAKRNFITQSSGKKRYVALEVLTIVKENKTVRKGDFIWLDDYTASLLAGVISLSEEEVTSAQNEKEETEN